LGQHISAIWDKIEPINKQKEVSISNLRVVINMNLKIIDRINRIDRIRSDIDIL